MPAMVMLLDCVLLARLFYTHFESMILTLSRFSKPARQGDHDLPPAAFTVQIDGLPKLHHQPNWIEVMPRPNPKHPCQ